MLRLPGDLKNPSYSSGISKKQTTKTVKKEKELSTFAASSRQIRRCGVVQKASTNLATVLCCPQNPQPYNKMQANSS